MNRAKIKTRALRGQPASDPVANGTTRTTRFTAMQQFCLVFCVSLIIATNFLPSCRGDVPGLPEDAIRQSAQQFVNVYDKGDAKGVAALWTPDGDYTIGHQSFKGRTAIANLYEAFFHAHPGSTMKVNVESVRLLAPTVAIEQGVASTNDGHARTESAYTAVHVRQHGKWLMASVRESENTSEKSAAELTDLAWLIGSWTGEGDAAKSQVEYSWMANKHFIKGEFTSTVKDGTVPGGTQIIGIDPQSGRIVSWFFNNDGGQGLGDCVQQGSSWILRTKGVSPNGVRTSATNVLYHPDSDVFSWKSVNRSIDKTRLPDMKEVVMERISGKQVGTKSD